MAESALSDLSRALDLIVLEQLPGGGFLKARDSYIPNWFLGAFRHAVGEDPVSLQDAFPVLDTFLKEAEALWSGPTEGRADSEPFIIVDRSGSELPVKATAVAVRGHRYLILQLAIEFNERRQMLQTAREQSFAHERMVRQLQDLRKPIATLAQLMMIRRSRPTSSIPPQTASGSRWPRCAGCSMNCRGQRRAPRARGAEHHEPRGMTLRATASASRSMSERSL